MKIFIYEDLTHITGNYHDGGGAVVIAETVGRSKEILKENGWEESELDSDCEIYEIKSEIEKCFIFPDAGCC